MSGPFREEEGRVARLEERVGALESNEKRATWMAWLTENSFMIMITIAIVIGGALGITSVRGCSASSERERLDETTGCRDMCSSMGLRGGVVIRWHNNLQGQSYREGGSCVCGNGMGGAIRVDPDGRQSLELQTTPAPDAGH